MLGSAVDFATWDDWRDYFRLVSWLVPDIYRHARLRVVWVVLLSTAGVSARVATIGSMLLYVRARSEGTPIVWHGLSLPTEASLPVFLLWGGIAVGFAALTIAASYRCDVTVVDIARGYMEMASRRVLRHQAAGRDVHLPEDLLRQSREPIAMMLRGDCYRLMRVVIQTLGMLIPTVTLLAAVCALFALNWILTLCLAPLVVVYLYGLGLLNQRVLRNSQQRQLMGPYLRRDVGAVLRTLSSTRYPAGREPEWLQSYPNRSWMQQSVDVFRGMILTRKRVVYIGDAFQGAALLIVVMVFGTLIAGAGASWAVLLSYLMALSYATGSMGRLSKAVTAANRSIPHVRRYVAFMQSNEPVKRVRRERSPTGTFLFEAQPASLPGSLDRIEAKPGEVYYCVPTRLVTNAALGEMCFALAGGDAATALRIESETFFMRGVAPLPARPVRGYLPRRASRREGIERRVQRFFDSLGVAEEFANRVGDIDAVLTPEIDAGLSPLLRYALRLLPGVLANPHLFVLDREPLDALGEPGRHRVLAALSDRLVLLVPQRPGEAAPERVSAVMVLGPEGIRGMGDVSWYAALVAGESGESPWTNPDQAWCNPDGVDESDDLLDEE